MDEERQKVLFQLQDRLKDYLFRVGRDRGTPFRHNVLVVAPQFLVQVGIGHETFSIVVRDPETLHFQAPDMSEPQPLHPPFWEQIEPPLQAAVDRLLGA